ncbi:hypothetical protein Cfor_01569 [Coptotermes formosanus]|uniref:Large ribosomal subunit protein mL54 n=1 Tax=Coptotermes formosanus TaxID=36987 RepID=A0A6L2PGS2_COPFO|nr:hypothetical protein Cfor_01569 [Coptotermes formosanus]
MTSSITLYFHTPKIRFLPLLLTKCSYAKKIEAAGGIASLGKKKKLSKLGPMMEKKVIPVETDTQKLVNYVCGSNLLKEGEDVRLKPDDEYPDWLWTLRTGEKEGPYIGRAGSKHKRVLEKGENNGYQKKEPIIKTQEILGLSTKFICAAYHNLSEMLQLSVRLCYKCVKIIKGTSHQSKLHLTSSLIRITAVLNEYSDCVVIHGVL